MQIVLVRSALCAALAAISMAAHAQSVVPGASAGAQGAAQGASSASASPVHIYISGAGVQGATAAQNPAAVQPLPNLPDSAFSAASNEVLPLSPGEATTFRRSLDDYKRATGEPIKAKKPAISTQVVDLSPGATPPVVRASKGYGTLVALLDETGAPWPILGADGLAPAEFDVAFPSGAKEGVSVLQIMPKVSYGSGNVSVLLKGMDTPIMFSVEIGFSEETDFRTDMRIPARGPNAVPDPAPAPMPAQLPKYVVDILHGIPPSFAAPLKFKGGVGKAYRVEDKLVVRTPMTVLSPVPQGRVASADGMAAYLMDFAPVLLVSQNGTEQQVVIEE